MQDEVSAVLIDIADLIVHPNKENKYDKDLKYFKYSYK